MSNFKFLIRKQRGPWPKEGLPAFVLEQDRWNDYGFQTLYRLSYVTLDQKGHIIEDLIGPVKILRAGQTTTDKLMINNPFNELDENFCSVGTSLDYYERIKQLSTKLQKQVLNGLRDVIFLPELVSRFRKEEGWKTSLFRDGKDEGYLQLASGLMSNDYSKLPGENLHFTFNIPGWIRPTTFDFTITEKSLPNTESRLLPSRISVLVGSNGSGKSTALSRITRVAYGTIMEREKEPLNSLGVIQPHGIGFPRIISVTFSPFDSFRLPGIDGRDRKKIIQELKAGEGRFAFIGIRDIAAEKSRTVREASATLVDGLTDADRLSSTRLKSIEQLALEFERFLDRTRSKERTYELNKLFSDLLGGSAFSSSLKRGISNSPPDEIRSQFFLCSTGHKIAALVIAGLIATLERSSLVLFDEPETHLHPPLLASLMYSLRSVLHTYKSYCIIATHSPVVVQESLATHVKVVRRDGSLTSIKPPKSETFGESIGIITSDVFGLNAEATDYHRILEKLVNDYNNQEEVEKLFLNGKMSHQARSYVMGRRLQLKLEKN